MSAMHRITFDCSWPLHGRAASRELERLTQVNLAPHALMQRAGLACARLARAIAPHARSAWVACGPGNNGGDGFEAAVHLQRAGLKVHLTWTGAEHSPADAQAARERALTSGLVIQPLPPERFDVALDALLGLGGSLAPERGGTARMVDWLTQMHARAVPVLAIDLPSGLNADTGCSAAAAPGPSVRHTLSLLSLKPGLFTAQGRDLAGTVWFDDLGSNLSALPPTATLVGADRAGAPPRLQAPHASHKGSFGDVVIVGGQTVHSGTRMAGAALLAARAALHHGAGRVYVSLLGEADLSLDLGQPELMFRSVSALQALESMHVTVAGCGGGQAMADVLPELLARPHPLVLDADGLNAVATDAALRNALVQRSRMGAATVLTPHPLEAARLLGGSAAEVQSDRLRAAQALADQFTAVVVLKGSGTVVTAPEAVPAINPTGNALLATAGTGDVLAGMVGAALAQGLDAHQAAMHAVFVHGARAQRWAATHPDRLPSASDLLS